MSKGLSIFLTLLAFIGWSWFSHWWYTCKIMESGRCEPQEAVAPVQRYSLDFKWSDATAFTNAGFDQYKQDLLDALPGKDSLYIIGQYFEGESSPEGFENIGLARAAEIKRMLSPPIDSNMIVLKSRLREGEMADYPGYFESVLFNWVEKPATVEKTMDGIVIRFPFGGTTKSYDKQVDDYLIELAAHLKETGKSVSLTGHTDNVDSDKFNMGLGLRRAKEIRNILIKLGVDKKQINTNSKGETDPVASNDTEDGRYKNRRVVVKVLND